jgi:hypothetical protein
MCVCVCVCLLLCVALCVLFMCFTQVFNLSPDLAITRSLRTFGMGPDSTTILFVLLNGNDTQRNALHNAVQGQLCHNIDASLMNQFDATSARRVYSDVTDDELVSNGWRAAIVNRISCKISRKVEML